MLRVAARWLALPAGHRFATTPRGPRASSHSRSEQSGGKPPHSRVLHVRDGYVELIFDRHPVNLHRHDPPIERARGTALEPTRGTPAIERRLGGNAMVNGVPMDVAQAREIGLRIG